MITQEEIINWARSTDWTLDRNGNLGRTYNDHSYRLRFGGERLIYEVWTWKWERISSTRYKNLSIVDGKLIGFKIRI